MEKKSWFPCIVLLLQFCNLPFQLRQSVCFDKFFIRFVDFFCPCASFRPSFFSPFRFLPISLRLPTSNGCLYCPLPVQDELRSSSAQRLSSIVISIPSRHLRQKCMLPPPLLSPMCASKFQTRPQSINPLCDAVNAKQVHLIRLCCWEQDLTTI